VLKSVTISWHQYHVLPGKSNKELVDAGLTFRFIGSFLWLSYNYSLYKYLHLNQWLVFWFLSVAVTVLELWLLSCLSSVLTVCWTGTELCSLNWNFGWTVSPELTLSALNGNWTVSALNVKVRVKVKVMLRSTVSRPVCLGINDPSWAYDQIFITVRQLRVCWCGVLSLTRGRVCHL
jgi:hypothetical protein